MPFQHITHVYLVGIGGIGMSGLARYFKQLGKQVAGYDKTATPLTRKLQAEGMDISFSDKVKDIPAGFRGSDNIDHVLVIYTPAIPSAHEGLQFFRSEGYDMHKRAAVLGMITSHHNTLAVAGTHGKTTTSSILAHLLQQAGLQPTAFIGGIMRNYQSNVLLSKDPTWMVVEADEYDRSFLQLNPYISVITSLDADHLDIYGTASDMRLTYQAFAERLSENGRLWVNHQASTRELVHPNKVTYGLSPDADYHAGNVHIEQGHYVFDIIGPDMHIPSVTFHLPGHHNVENAIAAACVAYSIGIEEDIIRDGLATYQGVKRRFEYVVKSQPMVYIDDYAHHPSELNACIRAARDFYPERKITGIFQPHLFSRTRDFMEGFAESLSALDCLILLDIYPARELPIDGITSSALLEKVHISNKMLCTKEAAVEKAIDSGSDLILTLGAGDIDELVDRLRDAICEKFCLEKEDAA
ncbi:MAG: UDP-N-acetylmuramate--L-alanine ligase [Flavobacteriales bacterium]|nr:UDP-N-acetylmuramate--L-alanine ligase [Flavobacteriales bacterium]MCB9449370.1 UDP-N-acetylmuramate--L-alanine ligase [Flavobacteriales bacterium]